MRNFTFIDLIEMGITPLNAINTGNHINCFSKFILGQINVKGYMKILAVWVLADGVITLTK
jgi:hypothetical protein